MFVKVNGERLGFGLIPRISRRLRYLWRAVAHEGEILESYVTKKRDKSAALPFLKKALKRHGRAENSHLPFRRSERAMLRFRRTSTLQKFVSVHASFQNHFNSERHLVDRETYKNRRSTALAEWQNIAA